MRAPDAGVTSVSWVIVTANFVADRIFFAPATVLLNPAQLTSITPATARAGEVINVKIFERWSPGRQPCQPCGAPTLTQGLGWSTRGVVRTVTVVCSRVRNI